MGAACTLQRTGMWHCLHFAPGPSAKEDGYVCWFGCGRYSMMINKSISWILGYQLIMMDDVRDVTG